MQHKESLKNLRPYKPGKSIEEIQKEYGIENIIKLASNENAYGTSKRVLEAVKKNKFYKYISRQLLHKFKKKTI